ncbi:MAG: PH domain-containing protein [Candidatus Moranbacteria bacterium]|nr:PH domain-containing protein [Candidatus Moranbacteria bacterium]
MDGFSKYHFRDLEDGDEILHVYHRNWFYLLQQYLLVFLMLAIFLGAVFYLPILFPSMVNSEFRDVALFLENVVLLALWLFGFLIWVDYYFDIWIITSERIVNIEQKGLFTRHVSELRYNKIEDITTEVTGFFPTILNFGDVKIQTAAEEAEFRFRTVSDPYRIKNIIMELQKKHENDSTEELGDMIKEKISA